jgi:hypothetical protein
MTMTKNNIFTTMALLAIILAMVVGGCKKDSPAAAKTTYQLMVKDQLGVSGTVTFTQLSSTVTIVDIALTGGDSTSHPAHIHLNSAVEGGAIAVSLNPVVGGKSSTMVSALDNTTAISYNQLLAFDGYVNVHESITNLGTIIAQGDIGGNALTSSTKSYALDTVGAFGVFGTALFSKRVNGNTLVSISLTGAIAGGTYPAAIHLGSVATVGGGPVVKTLTAIDGTTGKSFSNIRTLDNGTVITYDNLLVYDGYLAVTQSAITPVTICQGNIGTH